MKNFFSISETAKMAGMTAETLRHYDRIGLVKPCKVDKWTGYRYYSRQDVVRLDTIRALRCMDLTLSEIKEILSYDDFGKIADALKRAEKNADEKIAELHRAKAKIRRARMYYQSKSNEDLPGGGALCKILSAAGHPVVRDVGDAHAGQFAGLPPPFLRTAAGEHEGGFFLRGPGGNLRAGRTAAAVCRVYEVQTDGRHKNFAAGKLLVR